MNLSNNDTSIIDCISIPLSQSAIKDSNEYCKIFFKLYTDIKDPSALMELLLKEKINAALINPEMVRNA